MKDLISIVVPVYNSEKTIKRTIESIIHQTYKNLEILIIDDGSTDNSANIIMSVDDSRISYVYQANQGPATAKNTGIERMSGSWLLFVDSDDIIEKNTIDKLHSSAISNDSDLVVFSYKRVDEMGNIIDNINVSSQKIDEMFTAVWNKFYKRSIITQLLFPEKVYFEDVAFSAMAASIAKNIITIDDYLYFYTQHSESLTKKNWLPIRHEDIIIDFDYMFETLEKKDICLENIKKTEVSNLINKVLFSHIYQVAISKNKHTLKNETINRLLRYQKKVNKGSKVIYSENNIINIKDNILMYLARLGLYNFIKLFGTISNKMGRKLH